MSLHNVSPGPKAPEEFNVIIEIPMNADPIKYEVDEESGALFVDRFMGTAMHYPCNYGYIPKTLADDGDPGPVTTSHAKVRSELESLYAKRTSGADLAALKEGFRQANPGQLEESTAGKMMSRLGSLVREKKTLSEAEVSRSVLFIDASKHYESAKNQNKLRDTDIEHIVNTYRDFAAGKLQPGVVEDKFSYVATAEEIQENDFNLNIPRYVDTFEEEAEVDIAAVQSEIDSLEKELKNVQIEIDTYLKDLIK
jgi:hypothetical protein